MMPTLSFKLLPNINLASVGTSLVKWTSFGDKILDKSCILMFSPSRFAIPQKIKLSVKISMTLGNSSLSSLPEISLLFLRLTRLFVTSQIANAPLRTDPWTFSTFDLYYDPERSFVHAKSLYCIFFTSKSEQFCGFQFGFELFKSIRVLITFF